MEQTDGRIHRVASAHPVAELEHVRRVDAEALTFSALVETATKCLAMAAWSPPRSRQEPVTCAARVGHGLQRGESLGGDDEERLGRVQVEGGLHEIDAVHVGDKPERHVALAVVAQGFVGHHGAEVRAADAHVDDVFDTLAGETFPIAAANAVAERPPSFRGPHARRERRLLPIHENRLVFRRAQRDVQNGAVFGDIDLLAANIALMSAQIAIPGELKQEFLSVSSVTRFFE